MPEYVSVGGKLVPAPPVVRKGYHADGHQLTDEEERARLTGPDLSKAKPVEPSKPVVKKKTRSKKGGR